MEVKTWEDFHPRRTPPIAVGRGKGLWRITLNNSTLLISHLTLPNLY